MLEELRIRGLGVIEDATLPLGPGLTVVTGETGAGKTMVVAGLLLLFGGRADAGRVRAGADRASVDGRVEVGSDSAAARRVLEAGGDLDDGTGLALRRTVVAGGRSRAHVGGAAAPVAVLAELGESLLAVHGQSDQIRLARPGAQRDALDRFAGTDLEGLETAHTAWRAAVDTLAERRGSAARLRREADLLQHGVAEISGVAPRPGEDRELADAASRLRHADALRLAARAAHDALVGELDDPNGGADVTSLLGEARRHLTHEAGEDSELDALATRLLELASMAGDLGSDFGSYLDGLDADPGRLEQLEERRALLGALVRKYGDGPDPDIDAVLAWARQAQARLGDLDVSDDALAALERRRDDLGLELVRRASRVRANRLDAAARLSSSITTELAGLAMPGARLTVEVRARPAGSGAAALDVDGASCGVTADGADEIEFLLRPHPDAPALPLSRGASGGELSRVMLALEVSLAGSDPVPTLVFDEVDAGVGGRAAIEIGKRLARLARDHQVLVVTHLAQVAAYADRHIVVDKQSGPAGVTASDVRVVDGDDRAVELARMLGGSASGTAVEHAAELLAAAAVLRSDGAAVSGSEEGAAVSASEDGAVAGSDAAVRTSEDAAVPSSDAGSGARPVTPRRTRPPSGPTGRRRARPGAE